MLSLVVRFNNLIVLEPNANLHPQLRKKNDTVIKKGGDALIGFCIQQLISYT